MSGWMVEGCGYQLPYGSTKWPPSTRPVLSLAGFRHHAMTMASNGQWVKETQSLQGHWTPSEATAFDIFLGGALTSGEGLLLQTINARGTIHLHMSLG